MATYGYCRVSTDRQAEDGESLEVQRRKLEGRAMQDGLKIDHIFVERGISGARPLEDRPEGRKLVGALEDGDIVIASKLDRMFRSATDALRVLEDLKRRKVSLILLDMGGDVTGDGVTQLVFAILSAVAQFERERLQERIAEVKADQKARGRYLGGTVPFGWAVGEDGELIAMPEQQRAISRMVAMRNAGKSLRFIADTMTAEGFEISHMGVKKVVAAALEREVKEQAA